jgi:hypothetical protein
LKGVNHAKIKIETKKQTCQENPKARQSNPQEQAPKGWLEKGVKAHEKGLECRFKDIWQEDENSDYG